ncbi:MULTISPECIES: hypothetical protein [Acinetobacter]|uniref:hypothetical protein n=1 Tax=Acinetobacter TaxID=469 RepID=UPI002DBD623F|nr:hypothetical protein [Acinetobacter junii]MEB8380657.1 hypothetical protein [Acinetobacter junii]
MNEHPILFSTEMVQAILTGRKTQTRRVVKSELIIEQAEFERGNRPNVIQSEPSLQYWTENSCPFGQVGDRIWVRETWHVEPNVTGWSMNENEPCTGWIEYKAGGSKEVTAPNFDAVQRCFPKGEVDWDFLPYSWRPSIFMPRWACRLILEITNIRIERLNDISEADCVKEGIGSALLRDCKKPKFMQLWESINGNGSWNKNPWVWVVEFKIIQGGEA